MIRHRGYVCKGAQEFLSKEISNYISNRLGPPPPLHIPYTHLEFWNLLLVKPVSPSPRSQGGCRPRPAVRMMGGHLLRCDWRQERTKNQSAECGVVLLCFLFWSPENSLFHVGYCLSPHSKQSILGFEEEELKDGYHWLTSEFYSERYLILIVLPFNSLWK